MVIVNEFREKTLAILSIIGTIQKEMELARFNEINRVVQRERLDVKSPITVSKEISKLLEHGLISEIIVDVRRKYKGYVLNLEGFEKALLLLEEIEGNIKKGKIPTGNDLLSYMRLKALKLIQESFEEKK